MAYSKRFLKYKKRSSWRSLCNSITKDTPINEFWETIRKFKRSDKAYETLDNNTLPEILNRMTPDYVSPEIRDYLPNLTDHFILKPFSLNEMNKASAPSNRLTRKFGPRIRVHQFNFEGITFGKYQFLQKIMTKYAIDVVAIQETHAANKDPMSRRGKLQGFDLLGTTYRHIYVLHYDLCQICY
ncbi:hypothetical protein QE152_g31877 [Popillia japonica]|uniref:Endonuclease/exonuclease/phosphatase domain-containing protein n=1 Tax=Popillia japonica TaxID=7064 RepID=A0AAW1J0X2_POPJA